MKKHLKLLLIVVIISAVLLGAAVFAVPGGEDDPVVTLSYLNDVFMAKVKEYIDGKTVTGGPVFKVQNFEKGSTVKCSEGTELILRMGKAKVMASSLGGLSDITAGADIAGDTDMPANHSLIVPRDDGRGFMAQTDVIVLVKGSFTVEK